MIDTANTANARNSSKKRPRPHYHDGDFSRDQRVMLTHDAADQDGGRDLLDVLDALQCRTTLESIKSNNNIGTKKEEAPSGVRLEPGHTTDREPPEM